MAAERLKTHIRGLDQRIGGGIPEKHLVLVCGRAGTMKSSLAYGIMHNAAKNDGRRGIYITLEQSRESLVDHMTNLGMDPKSIKGNGGVIVIDLARLRKESEQKDAKAPMDWADAIVTIANNYKLKFGCNLFVLDSLAALYSIHEFKNPRNDIFLFFDKIRALGITTLLISETTESDKLYFGMYGVEDFLADGIFHIDLEREDRNVNLFLSVVKMRATQHDRSYYPLIVEKGNFEIVTS
jgi:KaiC/GvpD/RAD55 family RecA-like ATPase